MLAAARHSAIIAEVQRERIVRVADLAKMLGVSLMTVRRDIEALDAAGAGVVSDFKTREFLNHALGSSSEPLK